ncbi:hypothetical protein IWZ01DRAFT_500671 [Phyllosticta capitalensis]
MWRMWTQVMALIIVSGIFVTRLVLVQEHNQRQDVPSKWDMKSLAAVFSLSSSRHQPRWTTAHPCPGAMSPKSTAQRGRRRKSRRLWLFGNALWRLASMMFLAAMIAAATSYSTQEKPKNQRWPLTLHT